MAVPAQPDAPRIVWTSPDAVRVEWSDVTAAPAVTSWEVRWRTAAGPSNVPPAGAWQSRTGLGAATRAYTIADLDAATTYDVDLRAVNADGNSTRSDTLTTTTQEDEAMGILQADLTELQIGLEAANAAGTLVAATRKIPYMTASYQPLIERKTLEERGTVLADTTDVIVRRGSELELSEELNTETLIGALMCSLADVAPTALSGAEQWVFTPAVTSPSGLRTATIEIAATDGGTDQYRGHFGHARATAITIEAATETAQLTTTWMGRRRQALAAPAAVAVPERWIIPAAAFEVFIDDTWAALGTTRAGVVRSFGLDIDPGLTEAAALAGRTDLDAAYWRRGRIRGSLSVVVDHDGDTTGELTHWEDGDLRYIRLQASNGGSGGDLRRLRIDTCSRYVDTPDVLAVDGEVHTLDLASELRADSANNILRVEVVNGIDAF